MPVHLPQPKEMRDVLGDLLGREVTLRPGIPFAPGPDTPATVALYVDDTVRVSAVIACDLAFSAYAGGAIGLTPLADTQAAVNAGKLDDTLAENLGEVLNIIASIFNVPGADHLRLHGVHPAGPPLEPWVRMHTLTLGRREDLVVDIAGYGQGQLSIILT
ncbi:hypothetical protein E8D34_15395 [Nocardioides sp. GY 10113]|uniref:hypothetical protein n=1 Tax=Nocardioides sp. GY 10113 TaxID=2569761 RepID=UPI0010A7E0EA|nr:hypothetical protein [Nocardioides sp. GY 10113]TIC83517.1 hypothetical protein E8D34_15395 [Nocardioides sp. GY 10113]